jgi:hypothetical protein
MNLSQLSGIYGYFSPLLLTLATFGAIIPAQAQTNPTIPQMAQASEAANNAVLKKKAATVINLLAEGKYQQARAMVSSQLAEKLSSQQIEQIWQTLIQTTGPLQKQLESQVVNTVNADLVIINTQFDNTTGKFIVTFDKQQNIVGVDFPKIDTIDRIAEIFVNSLAANDYTRARGYLHPFLKTELFPQEIRDQWEALIKSNGPVKRIIKTEIRPGSSVDQVDVVIVTVEFEKTTDDIFIIFDEERQIVGVNVPTID